MADVVPTANKPPAGSWIPGTTVGVQGGIPVRTTIAATLSPGATTGQIETAIAAAGSGEVVKLNAGTFTLSGNIAIDRSDVTLRGTVDAQGNPTTILDFGSSGSGWGLIDVSDTGYPANNWAGVTVRTVSSGLTFGSTQVVLSAAPTGLAVGQMLVFDAPADETLVVCSTSTEGGATWGRPTNRVYMQFVKVTNISGSTVDFTPPIFGEYWDDLGSNQCYYFSGVVSGVGIEDLRIEQNSGGGGQHNIAIGPAMNCWVKNVFSTQCDDAHIKIGWGLFCQVEDCYTQIHDDVGSATYSLWYLFCGSILTQNNILYDAPCFVGYQSVSGSVFGYNFARKNPYSDIDYLAETHMTHGGHCYMNEWEGNRMPNVWKDVIHGNCSFDTTVRNRILGSDIDEAKDEGCNAINMQDSQWNCCYVGNVLGTEGFTTLYSGANLACYNIDTSSLASLTRIYNWNTVNDAVPAGEAIGSDTIEDSYYLSGSLEHQGNLGPPPYFGPDKDPASASDEDTPAGYRFVNGEWPAETSDTVINTTNLTTTNLVIG